MTLTKDEILAREPDRELDALVAKYVMFPRHTHPLEEIQGWCQKYSTEIKAAWEVVETLQVSHMYTDIRTCADFYEVWITIPPFQEEVEQTETVATPQLPEAICKAALLARLNL